MYSQPFPSTQLAPPNAAPGVFQFGSAPAAAAPASFGYTQHFSALDKMDARQPQNLGDGYVALPIWSIQRDPAYVYGDDDRARAGLLSTTWDPKGTHLRAQRQRSPRVWVDNFVVVYEDGMPEVRRRLRRAGRRG
jgi:hypothetical protein